MYLPTVTTTLKSEFSLFPLPSVAVHVTGVEPAWKKLPGAGLQTTVGVTPLLSIAIGGVYVTWAGALFTVTAVFVAVVMKVGACVSPLPIEIKQYI